MSTENPYYTNSEIEDGPSPAEDHDPFSPVVILRGVWAVLTLSMRRMVRSKFLWANLALAALPVVAVFMWAMSGFDNLDSIHVAHVTYEWFLRTFFLQFVVFFSANLLGFAVMRQDFDDQTLHYLLLQPAARWILVVGKLIACLALTSAICIASFWITYLLMTLPKFGVGAVVADLFGEGRFVILVKESLVLVLALLAYTTIAMVMGSFFKSGFYALILLAWEAGLPYLPGTMKFWTVMHYLQSLLPERMTDQRKLFELLGEPASVAMSLAVIIGVSLFFIGACAFLFQVRECLYKES